MTKRRRTLPPVSPKVPAELRPLISAMTEILETGEGVRGDPLDRKITLRDLVDSGIGKMKGGVRPGSGGGLIPGVEPPAPDLRTPPPPQGFSADGSFFGRINLSWQIPSELYRNHAYTNIYRSEEDNFANAVVVGREVGAFFSDYVRNDALDPQDPLQLKGYYYWITFTSSSDVEGPPNATAGLWAQPLPDLNYVMDLLSEQIDDSHLADSLRQEIELITAPESITGSVASRIAEERDDRIAALQDAYDAIDAEASARTADINTEQQARVDADSVLSTQITELSVKIDSLPVFSSGFESGNDFTQWAADATATITADAEAYTGLQSALITSTATAPSSATPEGATATIPEGTATAFAGRRVRISGYAKQPATGAATEFALAYATGDGDSGWQAFAAAADWTAFEFLYDVPAESTTVTDALAIWGDTSGNGNGILIDAISVQSATSEVPEFTAALEAEQQARADGDAALASDIQTLTAIADDNAADIASEAQVRASADETLASDIQATYAQFDDLRGEIVEEARVRATEDELLAGMQRVISAAGETQAASLYTLSEIRISEQEVVVQRVEGLEASMGDATAAIQQEETARVTADDALAQQINTVQSTLGDDVASVQQSLTTNVERIDGELVALGAEYTVQVQANGLVGGFGLYNDGTTIDAGFDVDRFWIGSSQDDKRKPFIIDGGVTYIDEAMIRDASIQEGKLGPITIGKLQLDDGTPVTTVGGLIRADAIDVGNLSVAEAATFTGNVFSSNYVSGSKGWAIFQNGFMEINEASIRGNVDLASITVNGQQPSDGSHLTASAINSSTSQIPVNWSYARDKSVTFNEVPGGAKIEVSVPDVVRASVYGTDMWYTTQSCGFWGPDGMYVCDQSTHVVKLDYRIIARVRVWIDGAIKYDRNIDYDTVWTPTSSNPSMSRSTGWAGNTTVRYTYPSSRSSTAVRVRADVMLQAVRQPSPSATWYRAGGTIEIRSSLASVQLSRLG
ncbi:hypothetical protein RAN53_09620 [Halomonas sp. SSL-5]|uniref:phage tail tip fiber protein n=1 Tax=Halomonas sp. SSL-5 TaxID=3065855 RepID=UPI002738E387|nr:hypothetical protein [Halomonas sp. SSL-5]MDY7116608.1 hypothetical protein [Halomonas sp. SSL-5]